MNKVDLQFLFPVFHLGHPQTMLKFDNFLNILRDIKLAQSFVFITTTRLAIHHISETFAFTPIRIGNGSNQTHDQAAAGRTGATHGYVWSGG